MAQAEKKPANLRADAMPLDGFVLSVDGKLKTRFDTAKDAMAAGTKLKESFPVIQVSIYDAAERTYTPVGAEAGASTKETVAIKEETDAKDD